MSLSTNLKFCIFSVSCVLVLFSFRNSEPPQVEMELEFINISATFEEVKYVLFWTPQLSSKIWHFDVIGDELFQPCKFSNCYATNNRSLRPIDSYAAVLFYSPSSHPTTDIPEKRNPNQRYVFAASETPVRWYGKRTQYVLDNFYNWTMSYRFDADLPRRHGFFEETTTNYSLPSQEWVKNKSHMAAWFVSNCYSSNKREELGKELQKYIDVDIYGKCGTLVCPRSDKCYEMLEEKYKFYLSFENSHCKDYSTEKLFRILQLNVIPVVYGGGNYTQVAPPHSVINVEDFDSVKDLADFLKNLSEDVPRYLEYFQWKKYYSASTDMTVVMCTLCEKLNDPIEPEKVYKDIKNWWFSKEMSQCKTGNELPKLVRDL